jgi:hypothetical protein
MQLFNEHVRECPICDGLKNVLCDEGERLIEEASAASASAISRSRSEPPKPPASPGSPGDGSTER